AARKHNRVVQVGTQRKSTPHLIDAKKQVVDAGLLGKIGHVDLCCYFHMRANGNPPVQPVPDFLDYEMWTGPAPLRPYDGLPHKRWWRTFTEYGNGIVGDMCVHILDTARWMLKLGWPKRISSAGGIYVQKEGKSNISDTHTAAVDKRGRPVADIEEGHISTASCILANIAMDLGRPLVYDPRKRVVVDDPDATKRLRREYRQPWRHPSQA